MTSVGTYRKESIASENEGVDITSDTMSFTKSSNDYESNRKLRRASYYASSKFGWQLLGLLLLLVVKLVSVRMVVAGFLIGVPNHVLLFIHHREPDPLNILSEIGLNMIIPTALFFGWIILFIVDPGNVHADGKWSWHYLTVFMSFSFFMLSIPLQIYYSSKMEEWNERDETFSKILESERGRELFKAHLAEEVSIENYLFYEGAKKWKSSYHSRKKKTVRLFNFLYDTFINDGSLLQINISEKTKKELDIVRMNQENQLTRDIFDNCIFEVFQMMLDSYPRFLRSEHHERYKAHITDSGMLDNSL